MGYVLSKPEPFQYAEERRLFYVAITRAKKHTYVMYNRSCPSQFVTEIDLQSDSMICPQCKRGTLKLIKEGQNTYGNWRLYACSNSIAHCDYTFFVKYHQVSEISQQLEAIKQNYVLRIREDQVEQLKKENPNARYVIIPPMPPAPPPIMPRGGFCPLPHPSSVNHYKSTLNNGSN